MLDTFASLSQTAATEVELKTSDAQNPQQADMPEDVQTFSETAPAAALSDLEACLQALLFVSPEPVSALKLASACSVTVQETVQALLDLQAHLNRSQSGIILRERAGKWSLATDARLHDLLRDYIASWDTRRLSAAALETMAIVAYLQPLTRAQIAEIRGVNSDSPLNSLIEKNLVKEAGCLDTPGNPSLYATTKVFLEKFGLKSLRDLDPIEVFAPSEEAAQRIAERLGGMREDIAQAREALLKQEERDHTLALEAVGVASPEEAAQDHFGASADKSASYKEAEDGVSDRMSSPEDSSTLNPQSSTEQASNVSVQAQLAQQQEIQRTLSEHLQNSLAASFGLSEKIDFTELIFDEDEE